MAERAREGITQLPLTPVKQKTPKEVMLAVEFLGLVYLVVVTAAVQSDL